MDRYPTIIILLNLPEDYIPKAEYVLRTYCGVLRLNPMFVYGRQFESAHLYYGPATPHEYPIKILYHETFPPGTGLAPAAEFYRQRELYPLDQVNFSQYKNEYIPCLFSQPGPIFSFLPESAVLRKDIVAGGFYFLTCWHEYILGFHGERHGRVDYRQSLQYRWDFTSVPVVDVYCQMLLFAMGIHLPQFVREISWGVQARLAAQGQPGYQNRHPGQGRFCISLSHDIDYWDYWSAGQKKEVFRYNLRTFFRRPVNASFKILGHALHKNLIHNPQRQARWILHREAALDIDSTWFLFGKTDYPDPRQNYIADPGISRSLLDILGGTEVGLHGSPASAYDADELRRELDTLRLLGFKVTGYRSHYLNFDYQQSFSLLEAAGIQYDSTLGHCAQIGFRAGISFPFFPFNIEQNRPFRVLEIPLIVMDTTLNSAKAMNLNPVSALRRVCRLIDLAAKYQSHLSLLWHNTSFDPIDVPFWGWVYWSALRYAVNRGAWITSLHNIYDEWSHKRN